MTTVYVTHDQREALTMSDRIAVVNFGRIMQLANPRQLYDQPANRFVADFIGDSTFLPVARTGSGVTFDGAALKTTNPVPDAASLLLMLRPERVRLLSGATGDNMNTFVATVSELVYQGDSYLMYAHLPDGSEISLRGAVRDGTVSGLPKVGDPVTLGLDPADTVVIDGTDS
jgi:putative spermidine/putrescine transport system ATP-binding protein